MNWISVKDRLPDNEKTVLIYDVRCRIIEIAYRVSTGNKELGIVWFYPENKGCTEDEVTHWMPLPEPPK